MSRHPKEASEPSRLETQIIGDTKHLKTDKKIGTFFLATFFCGVAQKSSCNQHGVPMALSSSSFLPLRLEAPVRRSDSVELGDSWAHCGSDSQILLVISFVGSKLDPSWIQVGFKWIQTTYIMILAIPTTFLQTLNILGFPPLR